MTKLIEHTSDLIEHSNALAKTFIEYGKAGLVQRSAQVLLIIIPVIISLMGLLFSLLFLSAGFVIWIGEKVNSYELGFIFLGVISLCSIAFISIVSKDGIVPYIRNKLVYMIYKKDIENGQH